MTGTAPSGTAYHVATRGNIAENYERHFVPVIGRPFGADLVERARLTPGERVLDVACGTGIVARLAAERVAPGGAVAGLDINPGMLNVARSLPSAIPISWYETPAESAPLPDNSFDVVFCALGLQFMTDRAAAVREMHRVLKPGGRVCINTPVPNEFFGVLDDNIARHIGEEAAGFVRAVFSLHRPDDLKQLLTAAGFRDIGVTLHRRQLHLAAPPEFLWQYIHATPLTAVVAKAGEGTAGALERAVVDGWRRWTTGDGMTCEQTVLVGEGKR